MLSRVGAARALALGRVLANLSSCVALDRFRGLGSVAGLEAAARELRRENSFLAGKSPGTAPQAMRVPCACLAWLGEKGVLSEQSGTRQACPAGRWERASRRPW